MRERQLQLTDLERGIVSIQGLRAGDELVALAGRPITREDWEAIGGRAREGLDLRVTRRRDGEDAMIVLRLGLSPK